MIWEAINIALRSIWVNKIRSFLTMLGIIIGISSVVMFMALGEGLRQDVEKEITSLGTNILSIIPGELDGAGLSSNILSGDILKPEDVTDLQALSGVETVGVMSIVGGVPRREEKVGRSAFLLGTSPDLLKIYTVIEIDKGRFFTETENKAKKRVIVLGPTAAEELFGEEEPLGGEITIGKDTYTVIGVTKVASGSSLLGGNELGAMSFLPLTTSSELTGGEKIFRMLVKVREGLDVEDYKDTIERTMLVRHAKEDFSILSQDDLLGVVNGVLQLLTAAISGIAAISLVVAGVGIMNIMLVSVTERTKEIGIRKAVGATTGAILLQFLIESMILSTLGALLAVGLSYGATQGIAAASPLTPVVTPEAVLLAVSVGIVVGLVFGIAPAYRAAKLDPIQALRYE